MRSYKTHKGKPAHIAFHGLNLIQPRQGDIPLFPQFDDRIFPQRKAERFDLLFPDQNRLIIALHQNRPGDEFGIDAHLPVGLDPDQFRIADRFIEPFLHRRPGFPEAVECPAVDQAFDIRPADPVHQCPCDKFKVIRIRTVFPFLRNRLGRGGADPADQRQRQPDRSVCDQRDG